jgi:hypothetical protein
MKTPYQALPYALFGALRVAKCLNRAIKRLYTCNISEMGVVGARGSLRRVSNTPGKGLSRRRGVAVSGHEGAERAI